MKIAESHANRKRGGNTCLNYSSRFGKIVVRMGTVPRTATLYSWIAIPPTTNHPATYLLL